MTTTSTANKITDEERIERARRAAEAAAARLANRQRKHAEKIQKKSARTFFLFGRWLHDRIATDPALRKLVKQTLVVTEPSDLECLHSYWQGVGEVDDFESATKGPRAVPPVPRPNTTASTARASAEGHPLAESPATSNAAR